MSTLTPEEVFMLADETCSKQDGGDYTFFGYTESHALVDFAAALEAELRKRWFAEPVAWAYVSRDPLDGGDTLLSIHKPSRQDAIPLYAEPQEGS